MLLVTKPCINVLKMTTVWIYLIWILRILLYNAIGKSTAVSYWINKASSALLFQDTLWLITKCPQTRFVCKVYKGLQKGGKDSVAQPVLSVTMLLIWQHECWPSDMLNECVLWRSKHLFFIERGESVSVSEMLSKAQLIPDITISV